MFGWICLQSYRVTLWCGAMRRLPGVARSLLCCATASPSVPPPRTGFERHILGGRATAAAAEPEPLSCTPPPPQRFAVHQPLSRTSGRFFPVAYVSQSQFLLLAARELQLFRTCGPQRGLRRSGENTVLIEGTRRSKRQPHFTSGMGRWTLMEHEAKRVLPAASGATCL